MKLALPVFGTRVSPRFDCAPEILVLEETEKGGGRETRFKTDTWSERERIEKLLDLGVETVICGGLDVVSARELQENAIKVYPWVTGDVKDVITCFQRGKLGDGVMVGRGGRCCGRWRFRRGWQRSP